ncbi:MAG: hypothetical protein ACYCQK_01655 [Acidiferrobacteraceae bacterium]
MTIAYTLDRLMVHQAVILRNQAGYDAGGAQLADDWQPHLTVACRLVWDRPSSSGFSRNQTSITPSRSAPITQGVLLLALGTDVTEDDRISQVQAYDPQTAAWQTYVDGLFEITAVLAEEDHMEVQVTRVSLGA